MRPTAETMLVQELIANVLPTPKTFAVAALAGIGAEFETKMKVKKR